MSRATRNIASGSKAIVNRLMNAKYVCDINFVSEETYIEAISNDFDPKVWIEKNSMNITINNQPLKVCG